MAWFFCRKSKSNGFMDLSFEILSRTNDQYTCAMAHYYSDFHIRVSYQKIFDRD
jgi:hypothetical protein